MENVIYGDDDTITPRVLEKCSKFIREHPNGIIPAHFGLRLFKTHNVTLTLSRIQHVLPAVVRLQNLHNLCLSFLTADSSLGLPDNPHIQDTRGYKDDDFNALIHILCVCPQLQQFMLCGKFANLGHFETLVDVLVLMPNLTKIRFTEGVRAMGWTETEDVIFEKFLRNPRMCEKLEEFGLIDCGWNFSLEVMQGNPMRNLKSLIIEGNAPGIRRTHMCLGGVVKNMPLLEKLGLSYNDITSEHLTSFIPQLGVACTNFKHLILQINEIDSQGMTYIAEHLEHMPKLQTLALGFNKTEDKDIIRLMSSAEKWLPDLRVLKLHHDFSNHNALAQALMFTPHLPNLDEFDFLVWGGLCVVQHNIQWNIFGGFPDSLNLCSKTHSGWAREHLDSMKAAVKWLKTMLVTARLSVSHADVGAEYTLPEEMVEAVCKHVCPLKSRIESGGGNGNSCNNIHSKKYIWWFDVAKDHTLNIF